MPPVRRQRVWCGVLRDPGLGAGCGCGSAGRATTVPGGWNGGAVFRRGVPGCPPPQYYINTEQHCGGQWNGAGKQRCHPGTLGWRAAMHMGVYTPKYM